MTQETLKLPNFEPQIAHNVINDLAKRARKADLGDEEYKNMPRHLRELEEHKLFFAMLEVRASERLAGRNVDQDYFGTGKKNDWDNTLISVELDGSDNDFDNEFSQNKLSIYAGNAILHTTVATLAEIRGLNSLDVLNLIGEPTRRSRSGENTKAQIERYLTEMELAAEHKTIDPKSIKRMDEISTELAKRLIELRKRKPYSFSIGFQVTDLESGGGNLLFITSVRDSKSIWGDPQLTDWRGNVSTNIAKVKLTDLLEDEIASEIVDPYSTKSGLNEYDFWIMPGESGNNIVTWNNRSRAIDDKDEWVA